MRNVDPIPPACWSARAAPVAAGQVILRGAVLVRAAGLREETPAEPLPDSLAAVLSEPTPRIWALISRPHQADPENGGQAALVGVRKGL